MNLHEIINVAQQVGGPGFDITQFELVQSKPVATAENNPVFQLKHLIGNYDAFAIRKDDIYVSIIIGHLTTFDSKSAFIITRTFTHPRYRNQGLITSLYFTLRRKLKYVLISDYQMSPETRSMWKKISQTSDVKVVDASTNKIIGNLKDFPQDQIFHVDGNQQGVDGVEIKNIRLMLEAENLIHFGQDVYAQNWGLPDNQIYTHLDVIGEYI